MPLSKARNRERMKEQMRIKRGMLQPEALKPNYLLQPNRYLLAHIKAYPEGFNSDGSYRKDYNAELDPFINPLLRPSVIPNSPDGRRW